MIKLCIFDLDGTVLNTLETIAHYVNCELKKNNIEPIGLDAFRMLVGMGAKKLIENALDYRKMDKEKYFDKILPSYMKEYNSNASYKTTSYEGIPELLKALRGRGVKLAIVSNKPDIQAKLVIDDVLGLDSFDKITGQLEGYPVKPDPTLVLKTIEHFGVKKEECLYIGDTSTDVETSKNAGIFSVGVTWGFRGRKELEESGADLVVDRPEEILEYIEKGR